MTDPIFWLGLSVGLVALSLVMVLAALIPAVRELQRAARSVEKLADTLSRELPPTLEAIRLTGLEITELTEEMGDGVRNAGEVVQQVNQGMTRVKQQTQAVRTNTRSVLAGVKAAWKTWNRQPPRTRRRRPESLPHSQEDAVEFGQPYVSSSDEIEE
ncbi:MAG TPA: DUF948 domain-containing protein [Oscillatoriales cyanobacterium M59_W2019_021]|nr:DUF948 domain-containing protein [Oscillatoriales cyanobacterium M4454_W2019_049]HIK52382.1 DUF948 domain-containing protein [Oscillatoriales cyanobacterium M59_W2019_021]